MIPLAIRKGCYAILEQLRSCPGISSENFWDMSIALIRVEEAQQALHQHNHTRAKELARQAWRKSHEHKLYGDYLSLIESWDVAQTVEQAPDVRGIDAAGATIESDCAVAPSACAGSSPAVPPGALPVVRRSGSFLVLPERKSSISTPSPVRCAPPLEKKPSRGPFPREGYRYLTKTEKAHIDALREAGWLWEDIATLAQLPTPNLCNGYSETQRLPEEKIVRVMELSGERPLYSLREPTRRHLRPEEKALIQEGPLSVNQIAVKFKQPASLLWRVMRGSMRLSEDLIVAMIEEVKRASMLCEGVSQAGSNPSADVPATLEDGQPSHPTRGVSRLESSSAKLQPRERDAAPRGLSKGKSRGRAKGAKVDEPTTRSGGAVSTPRVQDSERARRDVQGHSALSESLATSSVLDGAGLVASHARSSTDTASEQRSPAPTAPNPQRSRTPRTESRADDRRSKNSTPEHPIILAQDRRKLIQRYWGAIAERDEDEIEQVARECRAANLQEVYDETKWQLAHVEEMHPAARSMRVRAITAWEATR